MSLVATVSDLPSPEARSLIDATAQPAWTRQANQAATYPRMFAEVAQDHGVSRAQVLALASLPADALDDPAGRLSLLETMQVLDAIFALTGDRSLGFQAGLRLPLTAHGSLGYALMCAATPRQANTILERFWHLRARGVLMTVQEADDQLFFELVPELPMPDPLRDLLFGSTLTSMVRGMTFVSPMLPIRHEIWLQGGEPEGFERWRDQLPPVCFNMPRSGLMLWGDQAWLDQPLPTANPEALAQAIAQCERESALTEPADTVLRQTRVALMLGANGYPTPAQVAGMVHLSPRTLRRRLQEQGHSYKQLLDDARYRDSRQLLTNPDLEIQRIAELLGYADPANFTRAFKAWTGMTPSAWRSLYSGSANPAR